MRARATVRGRVAALAAAIVAIVASALFARGGGGDSASTDARSNPASVGGESRERAPDFTLATVGGGRFSLARQRGRVVVLNFTSPDCPTCAKQIPVLDRLAARFGQRRVRIAIVDVGGFDNDPGLRDAYASFGWTKRVPIAKDLSLRVANAYRITQMGMTVVVGRDGTIRWRGVWEDEDTLLSAIRPTA